MAEMIDRVAETLMRSRYRMGKPNHLRTFPVTHGILLPKHVQQSNWEECVRDAEAAIAAMREPTKEMVAALRGNSHRAQNQYHYGEDRTLEWQAAIDAALTG